MTTNSAIRQDNQEPEKEDERSIIKTHARNALEITARKLENVQSQSMRSGLKSLRIQAVTEDAPVQEEELKAQPRAAEAATFDGDAIGDGREVDGGVLVLANDDYLRLVAGGVLVADGGGVVPPSSPGAMVGVEVGEVDAGRVVWE